MICINCGKENINSSIFCKHCGHKLSSESKVAAPKNNKKSKRATLSAVGGVVLIAGIWLAARFLGETGTNSVLETAAPSKQEIVRDTVQQLKTDNALPEELDDVTIWSDVTEQPSAIRYIYTLHDVDESQVSNEALKQLIAPQLCQNIDVKSGVLDQDINMEYSYTVRESSQNYFFVVTKADCE